MNAATALSFEALTGGYGDITVVHNVSATLPLGGVLGIVGRNGTGKSTLLGLLSGHLSAKSGRIMLAGLDVTGVEPNRLRRTGLGYAPQEKVVFDELSVRENLTLQYQSRSLDRYEAIFKRFPKFVDRLDQQAGTLSGGEKKMLSFCRVMAEDTDVILLDEPSEGVQPENIEQMAIVINDAAREGRAIILVEQNLTLITAVAQEVIVIDHGACVHHGYAGPGLRAELNERLHI